VASNIFNFTDVTAKSLLNSIKDAMQQPAKGTKSKDDF